MKKSKYLGIFSIAAHWYFPQTEACELIDDCRKLLIEGSYTESDTVDRYGSPWRAARLLKQPERYRRWLAVFSILLCCLILPTVLLFNGKHYPIVAMGSLLVGGIVSFLWFPNNKIERRPMPKVLLLCLLILTFLAGSMVGIILGYLYYPSFDFLSLSSVIQMTHIGILFTYILTALSMVSTLTGVLGLICARITDHRWRAIITLCLTIVTICALVLSVMHNMNLNYVIETYLIPLLLLTILFGLGTTGAGLRSGNND